MARLRRKKWKRETTLREDPFAVLACALGELLQERAERIVFL